MTINIQDLREKIARATPASWDVTKREPYFGYIVEGNKEKIQLWRPDDEYYNPGARIDAELVVAAVNNVAALCDEVERLREACKDALPVIEYIINDGWDEAPPTSVEFDELVAYKKLRSALGKDE